MEEHSVMQELMEQERPYEIEDDQEADWAVRKIAEANADAERFLQFYEQQKQKVIESRDASVAFFTAALKRYFDHVPQRETKTQRSYPLPSGKLVLKKASIKYEPDNDALVKYLKESDYADLVKVIEKPNWADFKKKTKVVDGKVVNMETGEIVESVVVIEEPETFSVNVSGGSI